LAEIIEFPETTLEGLHRGRDLPQADRSIEENSLGTGWYDFDKLFKFYEGQFVIITGKPGAGKSMFMLNVLTKMALEQKVCSFMYVPENERYLLRKLRSVWQGSDQAYDYFLDHQLWVQASNREGRDRHTMKFVLDRARFTVDNWGVRIVLIDPWNELDRARKPDQSMTDYIGECIGEIKDFVRKWHVSVVVVAHPTKAIVYDGERVPTLYDIEGSANWVNKADNGLIIHSERKQNRIRIISAKVREAPGAGKEGDCYFTMDDRGIYRPMEEINHERYRSSAGTD
jgi:twinkle protein